MPAGVRSQIDRVQAAALAARSSMSGLSAQERADAVGPATYQGSHRREWIYSVRELRCSLNASQAVSLPSHLTFTVVGVAKSEMILLFNPRT